MKVHVARDRGWCLVEWYELDGSCTWLVSLDDGWDPRSERAFTCPDRPEWWLTMLRLGLGGTVGVA